MTGLFQLRVLNIEKTDFLLLPSVLILPKLPISSKHSKIKRENNCNVLDPLTGEEDATIHQTSGHLAP